MSDVIARDVVVSGLVQGVFFRASAHDQALQLGVTGWVCNEQDGSVRAHVEGPARNVAAMLDWCSKGPPRAVVRSVDVTETQPTGAGTFEVL
ncbi:MAG TPA: acylphosphatase [Nocardioidaceae bacterium]|nr:acylphosphatase [Nocardioidaceae bacterium]